MKKRCPKCKQSKPLSEFCKDRHTKDRKRCYCKGCDKKYNLTHKVERDKYAKGYYKRTGNKHISRERYLKSKFNMTLGQYDEIFKKQNGVCTICGGINADGRRLYVDHNHETGKVRGLLCSKCNTLIGFADDGIIILQSAINYLKSYKT